MDHKALKVANAKLAQIEKKLRRIERQTEQLIALLDFWRGQAGMWRERAKQSGKAKSKAVRR